MFKLRIHSGLQMLNTLTNSPMVIMMMTRSLKMRKIPMIQLLMTMASLTNSSFQKRSLLSGLEELMRENNSKTLKKLHPALLRQKIMKVKINLRVTMNQDQCHLLILGHQKLSIPIN